MPFDRARVRLFILKNVRDDKYKNNLIKKEFMSKFMYKEQHAVIVKCSSEDEQKKVFEELKKNGYKDLKLVSV